MSFTVYSLIFNKRLQMRLSVNRTFIHLFTPKIVVDLKWYKFQNCYVVISPTIHGSLFIAISRFLDPFKYQNIAYREVWKIKWRQRKAFILKANRLPVGRKQQQQRELLHSGTAVLLYISENVENS